MSPRVLLFIVFAATFSTGALAAQKPAKPPVLTSSLRVGKSLNVSIEHTAVPWGTSIDASSIGTLKTKRPIHLAGRSLAKGTFKFTLAKTADGIWQLALTPKKKSDVAPTWALGIEAGIAQPATAPLAISCRVDAANQASLRIEFGPLDTALTLEATDTIEAALAADPAIRQIDAQVERANVGGADDWRGHMPKPEVVEFDPDRRYLWQLLTNRGPITLQFMPDVAPMHVTSTIYLTRAGFYDGLGFHRVITGFMAQGGCPLGTGSGGCGYKYGGEIDPERKHDRPGLLSMANSGPDTDASQFFITFEAAPHLDGKHTLFGEVVQGMDVVRQLEAAGSEGGETSAQLTIESATVRVR